MYFLEVTFIVILLKPFAYECLWLVLQGKTEGNRRQL